MAEGRRVAGFLPGIGGLFGFLAPLGVFAPVKIRQDVPSRGGGRRDWDLTLVGIAYGSALTVGVSIAIVVRWQGRLMTSTSRETRKLFCSMLPQLTCGLQRWYLLLFISRLSV